HRWPAKGTSCPRAAGPSAGPASRSAAGPRGELRRLVVVGGHLLLAGQRLDRRHDLVGDLTPGATEGDAVVAAREVQGLPEGDGDPGPAGKPCADRLDVLGAGQAHWYDGHP